MRIGIIGLLHESNTFLSKPTGLADFEQGTLLTGMDIPPRLAGTHHELGGFLDGLAARADDGVETVPLFVGRALPSGTIASDCWNRLMDLLFEQVRGAGELDGLLVAAHGATVSEQYPDADGYWLARLRAEVGPELPIITTIDPHANLSREMADACDAILAYRTNPHLDQRERGFEGADMIVRTVRGEIRPVMRAAFPPMAINIERQMTDESPMRELREFANKQLEQPSLLSNSIVLGFPYSDVAEMGSATIAVTDNDPDLARRSADELARELWSRREDCKGRLADIEAALDQCETLPGPICLLDMGDNVGGGSAADGTFLAAAIHRRALSPAFVCLYDADAVQQAERAGAGAELTLSVGGKSDAQHGQPLQATFRVRSFHEGKFRETEPRHGGFVDFDQGRTAILETETGLTVMLTSRRMVPFSLQQLDSCNLNPRSFRVLVAKGVNAPLAAYSEVCPNFIRVNTPGSTCADMTRLEFTRRRRPLFPFEEQLDWEQ